MSTQHGFRVIHKSDGGVVSRNKSAFLRFQEEVFNGHDWSRETLLRHLSPDFIDHNLHRGELPGLEGFRGRYMAWQRSFTNSYQENLALVGEGELVAVLYDIHARHSGEFMGIEPTDRDVAIPGIEFYRIREGKITDRWGAYDFLTTALQIGANLMFSTRGGASSSDYDSTRDTVLARERINTDTGEGRRQENLALVGEGELVAVLYDIHARHSGEFMGIEPTDRDVAIPGIEFYRIREGKITDRWGAYDFLTTALQIGANLMFSTRGGASSSDYDSTRDTVLARERINTDTGEGRVKRNKDALHGFQEEVFNAVDWRVETLRKYLAEDIVDHNATPWDPPGVEGVKSRFSVWQSAFSFKAQNLTGTLEPASVVAPEEEFAMAGEDDILAIAYDLHAWQTGSFMGIEATDNKVTIPGIQFLRFDENQMIVEHWGIYDFMTTAEQIGAELAMAPRMQSLGTESEKDSSRISQ